ncbi:MAG: hypothetical protein IT289_08035 [Oligoflexia bacterium]|nr:hypothetical protein [Oligoflexia bacterium]
MEDQQAFEKLKTFFETHPACREAASSLNNDVEIGIFINSKLECTFFKDAEMPKFEMRQARRPDVTFVINDRAIDSLVQEQSPEIADLGINIVKSYFKNDVKIRIQGSILNLLTRGYLGVIKSGGAGFAQFLASHGAAGLSKIKDIFQKLKNQN